MCNVIRAKSSENQLQRCYKPPIKNWIENNYNPSTNPFFISFRAFALLYQSIFKTNGKDFIVLLLFKIGLSRFIKRLSLRSNLNLLDSAAKMSKLSKFIVQLHCIRWSDIADCLTFFRRFPVRLEIPKCSAALVQKWRKVFP